ncbi:metabotropic glutamate receptor 3-like isoform X2 [Centruroides vittatus]|uniref:metabotropic glutamate receptor 3-like isoform X2 n=1 Tax=Centruroides vittatus TaxID=120091 RepID=UPI00350FFECC
MRQYRTFLNRETLISVCLFLEFVPKIDAKSKSYHLKLNGDLILGGLFPMHEAGIGTDPDRACGKIKEEKGIQRMEAMLYALDQINEDNDLLPNVTLGAFILDTCSRDTYALEQSMEFVKTSLTSMDDSEYHCRDGNRPIYTPRKPVSGVIGAASSTESVMVANILRLFKIPQISYASTSTELSDKTRFGYFSRVVPPDNFQAQAMVDIVRKLGWNYVSTVASEGDYGEKGIEYFKMLAEKSGICIAVSEKITRNTKPEDFDKIIEHLSSKPKARGVVVFVDEDNCRKMLAASIRKNMSGHFLWIGSDSWGAKIHPVRDQEIAAEGAITILPKRYPLTKFDTYFVSLTPDNNKRNPWFKEFWKQHFNCTFSNKTAAKRICKGENLRTKYEQEGLVTFVVDAVYAMAYALHNMMQNVCIPPSLLCKDMNPPSGKDLLQYIKNVSFPSRQGEGIIVRFNQDGDAPGNYHIYQYQKTGQDKYDYKVVGEWTESLQINMTLIKWEDSNISAPFSRCSEFCNTGYVRQYQGQPCCWICVPCRSDEYISNDSCLPCPPGHEPRVDKTECEKLPIQYMTWNSPWAIIPAAFASLGILCTLFFFTVFLHFSRTPIIMASGRELCYVLLIGILLCYSMTYIILAKPTTITCMLLRVGLGLCLSICYSAIFTKTNRISRIFNQGIKSIKRPSYTSPRSQIAICLGLVSVQLIFAITWLIVEPPSLKEVYHSNPRSAVLQCGISSISLVVSLIYNMILIVLCTTYAFKTRKIPENFNEAKYVGFTMYSTCIVWLAFIPIYFGTKNDYKIQIASLCMCINISATVALGCFFTPKIYIVLCQPYKNVRAAASCSTASSSGMGTGYSHNMRFARPNASAAIATVATAAVIGSARPAIETDFRSTTNGEITSPSVEESSLS